MKFKIIFSLFLIILLPSCNKNLPGESSIFLPTLESESDNIGCWHIDANNCCSGFDDGHYGYCSDCNQCDPSDFNEDNENWVPGSKECIETDDGLTTCIWDVECADPSCSNYSTECDEFPRNLGTCNSIGICRECE